MKVPRSFIRVRPEPHRIPTLPARQRGSSVVEMALIAPVVLLLMVGIVELSLMFFTTLTMQYAVREGARSSITGQSSYLATIQKIKDSSMGMYDRVAPVITVNQTSYASATDYTSNMFGGPGDIVVLQLDCTWSLATPMLAAFFSDGRYHFTVATTMRNEVY